MNCEKCRDLVSEFVDGSLGREDFSTLNSHLEECLECAGVRTDLNAIVSFCRDQRGQYEAPPNERALWLRIRNVIESSGPAAKDPSATVKQRQGCLRQPSKLGNDCGPGRSGCDKSWSLRSQLIGQSPLWREHLW